MKQNSFDPKRVDEEDIKIICKTIENMDKKRHLGKQNEFLTDKRTHQMIKLLQKRKI